jgi:LIM and SH3 domain protein 1
VYSYEAQDEDEVGFEEGDLIIHTEFVAEGWMTGTVQRTGQRGMMPSNYVESVNDVDE